MSLNMFFSLVCIAGVEVDQHGGAFRVSFSHPEQALMLLALEVTTLHVRHTFVSAIPQL